MLGFLALHIAALLFWVATLVYLPVLLANSQNRQSPLSESPHQYDSAARFVFTQIASPAAIVAIIAGTVVFAINGATHLWLIAKLTLVALLVVGHTLIGLLVIRLERNDGKSVQPWCNLLLIFFCLMATGIIWLVLAKPAWEISG